MLTEEQINANKERYLSLIDSITVEGSDKEGFKNWLINKSDFFTAPASTKYHCAYDGGLCEHSLRVFDCLVKIVNSFAVHEEPNPKYLPESKDALGNVIPAIGTPTLLVSAYSQDSLILTGLLHDISKANVYEKYSRNTKDENGKWIQVEDWKFKDANNRFIYGSHEQNSEYIAHTFFPLSVEESVAILHHHACWETSSQKEANEVSEAYNRYSLALFLHEADLMATYYFEKI